MEFGSKRVGGIGTNPIFTPTFRYLRVIERGKLSILYFFCPSCPKGPTDFCSPFRKRVDVCGACTVVCWSWRGVEAFLV